MVQAFQAARTLFSAAKSSSLSRHWSKPACRAASSTEASSVAPLIMTSRIFEDGNVAAAILAGAFVLGLAIIVAMAIS